MYLNAQLKKKKRDLSICISEKLAKFMSRDLSSSRKIILKPNKRVDPNKNM